MKAENRAQGGRRGYVGWWRDRLGSVAWRGIHGAECQSESFAEVAKGRVCIDLALDWQLFSFRAPADIDAHVRDAVEKLGSLA
ncbi:MAG: hypothetical protein J7M15_00580 [Anaerolineae bacterium]|nr:hypothetical protein [Anaerolineae bacterium]